MRTRSLVSDMMLYIETVIRRVVLKARILGRAKRTSSSPRIYTALKKSPRILPQIKEAVIIRAKK